MIPWLFFTSVFDPETLFLENGKKVKKSRKQVLSEPEDSWFYVNFPNNNFSFGDFERVTGSKISSKDIINKNWITSFLSYEKYTELQNENRIKLYKVNPEDKISEDILSRDSENHSYFIRATKDYVNPKFTEISKIFDDFYEIKTTKPLDIASDSRVLSISGPVNITLQNRWIEGYIQSGESTISFDSPGPRTKKYFQTIGLDGTGVIVSLIDSGVNRDHLFFADKNRPFPYNKLDMDHRKVVRYVTLADDIDVKNGHGTHCAGTIAGHADCDGCALNLYEGGAPNAKLQVFDFSEDESKKQSISMSTRQIMNIMLNSSNIGSHIISCSWGTSANIQFTTIFDQLCFTIDNVTMVFAAGNTGDFYSIMSPADSKNVIAVGSTSGTLSSSTEKSRIATLVGENKTFVASFGDVFEKLTKANASYESLKVVKYDGTYKSIKYTNMIVAVNNLNDVSDAVEREAKVIVYCNKGSTVKDSPCKPLFLQIKATQDDIVKLSTASVRFKPSGRDTRMYSSKFSSKGPSILGLMKPDVSSIGENVYSADSKNKNWVAKRSGTSMATPSISAALAIIEQYFAEKRHRLDTNISLKNHFFKAFLIQTSGSKPTTKYGYGIPKLDNALVTEPFARGLRFFQRNITSDQHLSFNVSCKEGIFECTLAWNDPPTQNTQGLGPVLFADLDLYIVLPNGTIVYGNMNNDVDAFSTVEKVHVKLNECGNVEVHITANTFMEKETRIPFSIVYNGNFDHLNTTLNPVFPSIHEQAMKNVCNEYKTGAHCQLNITKISLEESKMFNNVNARNFIYTVFNVPDKLLKYTAVNVAVKNKDNNIAIRGIINLEHSRKLSYPQSQVVAATGNETSFYIKSSAISIHKKVYIALFIDSQTAADVKINITTTNKGPKSQRGWGEFPMFSIPENMKDGIVFVTLISSVCVVSFLVYQRIRNNNDDQIMNVEEIVHRV